jgi:hypothetical protein
MSMELERPAERLPAAPDRSVVHFLRRLWQNGPARIILGVALGAGGGAAYAHNNGCLTGSCPLTSNPLTAALFGGVLGASLLARDRKRQPS